MVKARYLARMADASDNRQSLQRAFARLADGDGTGLVELMADDFRWTIEGDTAWSGSWAGKRSVLTDLLAPLMAQFSGYRNRAKRMIADGPFVVVQCQGEATTHAGDRYDNNYCYVCRFASGKLVELVEYCDTELISKVLAPPRGKEVLTTDQR
jgi:ketosteroid isomerase-like protein